MTTISTLGQHLRMQQSRAELNRLTEEVANGTHADYFTGLGSQSGRGLAMRSAFQQVGFFKEAAATVASHLDGQQVAIGAVKDIAQEVRDLMLSVQSGADSNAVRTISEGAGSYLDRANAVLNQSYAGQFLFSGPATDTAPLRAAAEAGGGVSPAAALEAIKQNGHDLKTEAGMRAFLDEAAALFAGTHPDHDFDDVFYAGATDGTMSGIVDTGVEVSLDVRANDPAFRTVLGALHVLAAVPADEASPESYKLLAQAMGERLSAGVSQVLGLAAAVGHRQGTVAQTLERHERTSNLLETGLSELESIDDYAAATRLAELQAQMETSYAVTARLNRLSLVNYL